MLAGVALTMVSGMVLYTKWPVMYMYHVHVCALLMMSDTPSPSINSIHWSPHCSHHLRYVVYVHTDPTSAAGVK